MGLKRLFKSLWTGKDKTVSTFFDDGYYRKQLIPRDQQSATKTRKSSTGFRSIFKPAFSKPKAKKNNPTEATVTQSSANQVDQALTQTSSIDDSGCIKYSDTFVVANVPPSLPSSSDTSTGKGDSEAGANANLISSRSHTPETTISSQEPDTPGPTTDDDLPGRRTSPSRTIPYLSSNSKVQVVDHNFDSAISSTLRRVRSQVVIGKISQQHVVEGPIVTSRRSSISYPRHSNETNRILEVTDPLYKELDHGLVKLHKRTACIELAQWQRTRDRKCSTHSPVQVECPQPVEGPSLSPHSQSPNLDGTSSGNEDCEAENTGQARTNIVQKTTAEIVCHETAVNDPRCVSLAQASPLAFAEYRAYVEETIAFKDAQMVEIVSKYQALFLEFEDHKTRTEQQGAIQSRAVSVAHVSSSELAQLRKALASQRQESLDALQYLDYLRAELDSTNNARKAQDVLLFNAYAQVDELDEQLAKANTHGGHGQIKSLEKRLEAAKDTEEQQERQLFNAFQASQTLEGDKKQLEETVEKLNNLRIQVTNELIDAKSECERNLVQNMMMRDAMATDPSKGAEYDKTVEHLKGELVEADERAVQAEENNLQLQKDLDEHSLRSKAEIIALGEANRILTVAVGDLRSSKDSLQKSLNAFIKAFQSNSAGTSLETAIQTYHSDLAEEKQHDTRLLNMVEMHSKAVEKAKVLEIRCNHLETTAVEQAAKYIDLEHLHRKKCDAVDILQMETDAKKQEHEAALAKKDSDLAAAKSESTSLADMLSKLQYASADNCTAWFLQRQETNLANAKTALEQAEQRIVALTRDLRAKTEFERMDKGLRDLAAYQASQYPDLTPAARDEIKELKAKIEEYELKLCTPDVVPWAEHLRRIEEVRAQTTVLIENRSKEQIEAVVNKEITTRFGKEYVLPLAELGGHFWVRIQRLEQALLAVGYPLRDLDDRERRTLIKASKQFGVLW